MSGVQTYRVSAFNTSKQSENKIHDDTVARRFGFSGGLVPGVDVMAYMMHLPVAKWAAEEGIAHEEMLHRVQQSTDMLFAEKAASFPADIYMMAEKRILLERIEREKMRGAVSVTRFKGLGEMNPSQLRETTNTRLTLAGIKWIRVGFECRDFLIDLFADFGLVTIRRMFSGFGISADDTNFALALRGSLFLRADEQTIPRFEAEGSRPFQYQTRAKTVTVGSYWYLPERLYDDPEELTKWARAALAAVSITADVSPFLNPL